MKTRKKIVHIFCSFAPGGTEIKICRIINNLQRPEWKHIIVSINGDFSATSYLNHSEDIDFVKYPHFQVNSFINIFLSRTFIKSLSPDLLITYAWSTIDWVIGNSFFKCCPHIHCEEGFSSDEMFKQKFHRFLARLMFFRFPDKLLVCSDKLLTIAQDKWLVPKAKVLYIPNGIEPVKVEKGRSSTSQKHNEIHLGIVASLLPVKNHTFLLEVLKEINSSEKIILHIAGNGPLMNDLKEQSLNIGNNKDVIFYGHVSEPLTIYRKLDIFCLVSISEQMPFSVLEAMAFALPIAAFGVGDIKMMVSSENQPFITTPGDKKSFLNSLEKLITDQPLRQRIGECNRLKCESAFSLKKMTAEHSTVYKNLLDVKL